MGQRSSLPHRCSITPSGSFRKRALAWLGHFFPLPCGVGLSNSLSGSPPQSLPEPGPLSVLGVAKTPSGSRPLAFPGLNESEC
jgi:hypothetical protein